MDEFAEARRLQRWGQVERTLHLVLLVGATALVIVVLWRELRKGGTHAA